MRQLRAWFHRLGGLFTSSRREHDLHAELESHFQLHVDDNLRAGMTPEEARRAAVLKFGPIEGIKDEIRERASIPLFEILIQDVSYGLRRMRRQPGFTALIALTLALGVGANAAMFGLVDVLMFRTPAHVAEPDRIVSVSASNYVQYQDLRERLQSVELTAYTGHTLSFGAGPDAVPLRAECVTPSYLDVAGASPARGRGFRADDDQLGAPRTIVLSHAFWASRFGSDPRAIGAPVTVAGRPFEVIGVAPPRFTGLGLGAIDGWILLAVSPEACSFTGSNMLRSASGSWLRTAGRLRDGVTPAQGSAELAAIEGDIPSRRRWSRPDGTETFETFTLSPLYESRRLSLSADSRLALWLAGGAAVLFLLACANVAGLLWTHTLDRGREMAVRLQLGASRGRVFAQVLVEHMLIATLGGVAAVVVGIWIGEGVSRYFPLALDADLMSGRTLAVVAVLAFLAGVLSGVAPGWQASKGGTERFLRTGTALMGGRTRVRTALLSVQVGTALVLVTGAGLFVGSVDRYRQDFAYDLERVAAVSIDFLKSSTRTPHEIRAVYDLLMQRVRQLPRVERAALSGAPLLGTGGSVVVSPVSPSEHDPTPEFRATIPVTSEYFATLGLPIVSGRSFVPDDVGAPVAIINETLAAALYPGEDPVGRCLYVARACREVVGVSRPFRLTVGTRQVDSQIFVPFRAAGDATTAPQILLVRTSRPAAGDLAAIAAALQGAAPELPYVDVRTLEQLADVEARSWLLGATVFGLFGTLAVILAGIGIYGALAFSIRQRTAEIGVRMALGAKRGDIVAMVLRYAAVVVSIGLVLGVAGGLAGSRYVESLLFNVAAADPWTFAVAALVVLAAALLGCVVPALRAARVDPAVALRYD